MDIEKQKLLMIFSIGMFFGIVLGSTSKEKTVIPEVDIKTVIKTPNHILDNDTSFWYIYADVCSFNKVGRPSVYTMFKRYMSKNLNF